MTFADALSVTWRRAALFAVVFVIIGFVLDAVTGRPVEWSARIMTITLATGIYWGGSAWLLTRRQG